MEKKITQKNVSSDIKKHLEKYQTFYTSILCVLCLIFIWKKFGNNIFNHCCINNIVKQPVIISNQEETMSPLQEINSILSKM
jgi:hypothetical protein